MWTIIKQFFTNLSDAFKYKEGGYSLRKIIAYQAATTAGYISLVAIRRPKASESLAEQVILYWLVFILLLLGVVTIQKMIELKTGVLGKFDKEKTTITEKEKQTEIETETTIKKNEP